MLIVPQTHLSTPEVYRDFDAHGDSRLTASASSLTMCLHALRNGSLGELAAALRNDLATAAIRRCPVIHDIQHLLLAEGCIAVGVSGSGPAVFGLCDTPQRAQQISDVCRRQHAEWRVSSVRTSDPTVRLMSASRTRRGDA